MLAILPLFCFCLIFLTLKAFQTLDWGGSFLLAPLIWGTLLTVITEFLSLLNWISFWPVAAAWGIVFFALCLILMFGNWQTSNLCPDLRLVKFPCFERALLVFLGFIIILTGVIAWVSPPNTWDSMTYHMSRVIYWIQNKNIAFYPTYNLRQIYLNPWSEYAILHLQILHNNDRFVNFVQWFSMVGSLAGAALLAKELKASLRGQVFAAVICATIPMGILQASSTQSDYVVSFWLICFVYFSILFKTNPTLLHALGTGLALGLAILTKGTAYIYAFPFLAWLGFSIIKLRQTKPLLFFSFAMLVVLAINTSHYARNYYLFNTPLWPGFGVPNEIFSLPSISSNLVRNAALHLGTAYGGVNNTLESWIYSFHDLIGISPNDARSSFRSTQFHVPFISLHEDLAGNSIHFLLLLIMAAVYFLKFREKQEVSYVVSILAGFLLFSIFLKMQPWGSRLHLPWFVLSSPFIGLMLSRSQNRFVEYSIIILVMIASLPWVFFNTSRPLLGRENIPAVMSSLIQTNFPNSLKNKSIFTTTRNKKYFNNNPELAVPYQKATDLISEMGCFDVGIIDREDSWEYPIWVLLRQKMGRNIRLTHVNVDNVSRQAYNPSRHSQQGVCAVLAADSDLPAVLSVENKTYFKIWIYNSTVIRVGVFVPRIEQK